MVPSARYLPTASAQLPSWLVVTEIAPLNTRRKEERRIEAIPLIPGSEGLTVYPPAILLSLFL